MIKVIRASAEWCGPCKRLTPIFEEVKQEFPNVEFFDFDVDSNIDLSLKYSIRSVPTIIIENDGVVVEQIFGLNSKQKYVDAIAKNIFKIQN